MYEASWSYEQEELGKRLWREGHTASSIAARLCKSKNAVIGKANRAGWHGGRRPKVGRKSRVALWSRWSNGDMLRRAQEMWALGTERSEVIACQLGITAGSLRAKMSRDGITRENPVARRSVNQWVRRVRPIVNLNLPTSAAPEPAVMPYGTLPFSDLAWDTCRYPVGDGPFMFCAGKAENGSYCHFHHHVTHRHD